jgi:integrase
LLLTGQQRSDIVRMGRQHIRDGFLYVRQKKTNEPLEIPIIPQLAEIIAAMPSDHLTFLTTQAGQPFTAKGFGKWFRDRCNGAGVPLDLSAHGLRKAMCRRLADAVCTEHHIKAISGHKNLKEVADQKRLAARAMEMMGGTNQGQETGKLSPKVSQFERQAIEKKGK